MILTLFCRSFRGICRRCRRDRKRRAVNGDIIYVIFKVPTH